MKRIGQGWQYAVYDLENGRVLKKFHSWIRAYIVILIDIFPFNQDSLYKIPSFIKCVKRKAGDSFEIIERKNIPLEWMANPKFINKYDFEQDKITPLHRIFENLDTEDIKRIIDRFVEFNKKLINIGVIDKGFNITKNYGINNQGEIVLSDIGELFDEKELIKKQIKDRAWDKDYVSGEIKNKEVREYFIKEMDINFNIGML